MSNASCEFIFQSLALSLTLTRSLSLILEPLPKTRRSKTRLLPWVWPRSGLLINNTSCFSTVRKEEGSKVWGEWQGPHQARTSTGTERTRSSWVSPCFFLLNDSHAKANGSEMCKLYSAFHEFPNELVIFVFVFPISLLFPWKYDCSVFHFRLKFTPPLI